jgi:hypothetical protein
MTPASRQVGRRPRGRRLHCEELELRLQPSAFAFSTGAPDGLVATISEPANAHNADREFESADDFVLTQKTQISSVSFTGLLTGGATPTDVSNVVVEIYRVFPKDSNTTRTPKVPTRVNSPSDVAFRSRDSSAGGLTFQTQVLNASFSTLASVRGAGTLKVNSGGNGRATGKEVEFDVSFGSHPITLPADHYFFVPQVGLSATAPTSAHFLWLSAPKPIVPPGTPFPAGTTDLQSWMRDDPPLAPDWLRIGTDIIEAGAPPTFLTFNASFALSGQAEAAAYSQASGAPTDGHAPDSAAVGPVVVIDPLVPVDPRPGHHRGQEPR